jgi:hypothetical protein
MAVANLQINLPMFVAHYDKVTTVEIKQYGPGNLRISSDRDSLLATIGAPVLDGIVQVTADGFKQHFWKGDLWFMSDAAGAVVYVASEYQYTIDRGKHIQAPTDVEVDSEFEGDLSTY